MHHGLIWVTGLKEVVLGGIRADTVLHVKLHVDDVFIVGKHQRFP